MRTLPPELERLERRRSEITDRMRWLGPNSRRRRQLRADQVQLTHQLLEREIALATAKSLTPVPEFPDDEGVELKYFQK